ncbi:hypothetical protein Tco_1106664 [Tanacetum coccineum]
MWREHPLKEHGKIEVILIWMLRAHDMITRIKLEELEEFKGDMLPLEVPKIDRSQARRLQSSGDKDSLGDDASKQGRIDIDDINTDAEITLIDETQGRINDVIADEDITLIPKLIIKLLKM